MVVCLTDELLVPRYVRPEPYDGPEDDTDDWSDEPATVPVKFAVDEGLDTPDVLRVPSSLPEVDAVQAPEHPHGAFMFALPEHPAQPLHDVHATEHPPVQ